MQIERTKCTVEDFTNEEMEYLFNDVATILELPSTYELQILTTLFSNKYLFRQLFNFKDLDQYKEQINNCLKAKKTFLDSVIDALNVKFDYNDLTRITLTDEMVRTGSSEKVKTGTSSDVKTNDLTNVRTDDLNKTRKNDITNTGTKDGTDIDTNTSGNVESVTGYDSNDFNDNKKESVTENNSNVMHSEDSAITDQTETFSDTGTVTTTDVGTESIARSDNSTDTDTINGTEDRTENRSGYDNIDYVKSIKALYESKVINWYEEVADTVSQWILTSCYYYNI